MKYIQTIKIQILLYVCISAELRIALELSQVYECNVSVISLVLKTLYYCLRKMCDA